MFTFVYSTSVCVSNWVKDDPELVLQDIGVIFQQPPCDYLPLSNQVGGNIQAFVSCTSASSIRTMSLNSCLFDVSPMSLRRLSTKNTLVSKLGFHLAAKNGEGEPRMQ